MTVLVHVTFEISTPFAGFPSCLPAGEDFFGIFDSEAALNGAVMGEAGPTGALGNCRSWIVLKENFFIT